MEFGWGEEDPQCWKCKSTRQPSNFHSLENLIELPCLIDSKMIGEICTSNEQLYSIKER
jgi:hypothetical protein